MEFFKRLTELLTPPPTKMGAPAKTSSPRLMDPLLEDHGSSTDPLRDQVRILVATQAVDDPRVNQAIEELKRLANASGLYVTASKMRIQLDSMRNVDPSNETANHKDRGYVLAADFIYQHIMRELRAIEANNRVIGPNIFRSYCNELVACLLQGKNPRRGIELPVNIIDALLEASITTANFRTSYLEMTAQAIESTLEQATAKFEVDSRERVKRRGEQRKTDTPTPTDTSLTINIDAEVLAYVKDLHDQLARLRRPMAGYEKKAVLKAAETGTSHDAERSRQHLDYLTGLARIAEDAGYQAFVAMTLEHVAHTSYEMDQEGAKAQVRRAAALYEALGDHESSLALSKLAGRRFKRARDIYQAMGDAEHVQALAAKLGSN